MYRTQAQRIWRAEARAKVLYFFNALSFETEEYTYYRGFVFHRYKVVLLLVDLRVHGPAAPDHGVRATARAPSRTPLSQSASALLNVKVCNCGNEVHQNGASADTRLPSSILQQLVHLSFMLHACREWLYRQVSLLSG